MDCSPILYYGRDTSLAYIRISIITTWMTSFKHMIISRWLTFYPNQEYWFHFDTIDPGTWLVVDFFFLRIIELSLIKERDYSLWLVHQKIYQNAFFTMRVARPAVPSSLDLRCVTNVSNWVHDVGRVPKWSTTVQGHASWLAGRGMRMLITSA
jgi:hypothetical protein